MEVTGIEAGRARAGVVDVLVAGRLGALPGGDGGRALVALGAYGSCELTPQAEADLLVLHADTLSLRTVTETLAYPLGARGVRVEASVRTIDECAAGARRSVALALGLLDARLVAGDLSIFEDFSQRVLQPLRRDRAALRKRIRVHVEHRHAAHAAASSATIPDLVNGRGGLRDIQVLRRLEPLDDQRLRVALDLFLHLLTLVEEHTGHGIHRLIPRHQEWLASASGLSTSAGELLGEVYRHARWVAFRLDGVWAPAMLDRLLGEHLELRRGRLVSTRPPPDQPTPALALRVTNLVGLAPPDPVLLEWAATPAPMADWDAAAREQLWLFLRAADWRAWDFLDATGLVSRLLPQWDAVARRPGSAEALDTHSFKALRRLHEWSDSDDVLARRVWVRLRHRDWLYLAVLLHECAADAAREAAARLGLPAEAQDMLAFLVGTWRLLEETATQRDLHDEDLVLDLAARIGSPVRLDMLFGLVVAHTLVSDARGPSDWTTVQMRRLFQLLERTLRGTGRAELTRRRSVDQQRARLAAMLDARGMAHLQPLVARLPRRYLMVRTPSFILRHLQLVSAAPLEEGEVRMRAERHRQLGAWDVLVAARDRPGLLSTLAGVLALRGATVLSADATTCSDGLVLDVFTVASAYGAPLEASLWPRVEADLRAALAGHLPLEDLLAVPASLPDPSEVSVAVDNSASEVFSVVEVRAPDQVGLLYRIARGLHDLGLDIHHAKIATHASGVQDAFYVWDLAGEKLSDERSVEVSRALGERLTAAPPAQHHLTA